MKPGKGNLSLVRAGFLFNSFMLALLSILVLFIIPLILFVLHLIKRDFPYSWLISVFGVSSAFLLMFLLVKRLPQTYLIMRWWPITITGDRPLLLVDQYSWPIALSLILLALVSVLTAVSRPAQDAWQEWVGILVFTGLGLPAILAGNVISFALAWVALDLLEAIILLTRVDRSEATGWIILSFSGKIAGVGCLVFAGIIAYAGGQPFAFSQTSSHVVLLLLLASILRLGIIPIHAPFYGEIQLRTGLGTILRLISLASGLILIVRIASTAEPLLYASLLFWLFVVLALYGSWQWLVARDELDGSPFWIIAVAAFAVISTLTGKPSTTLAWCLAGILSGGLLFYYSTRHRNLLPLVFLGLFGISGLPFSPVWLSSSIYTISTPLLTPAGNTLVVSDTILAFLSRLLLLFSQVLLMLGYIRHALRTVEVKPPLERWMWVLYPSVLFMLPLAQILLGWLNRLEWYGLPLESWFSGLVICSLTAIGWFFRKKILPVIPSKLTVSMRKVSFKWINELFRSFDRYVSVLLGSFTKIMEGEGGILWSLVILALLFTVLVQLKMGR